MTTEIIKTEDPNIVIERTVIDKEINLEQLSNQLAVYETENNELAAKMVELLNYDGNSQAIKDASIFEAHRIQDTMATNQNLIDEIKAVLDKIE